MNELRHVNQWPQVGYLGVSENPALVERDVVRQVGVVQREVAALPGPRRGVEVLEIKD